jgi:LmbE family N-acetylglucosaminyl deacetylase
MLTAPSRDTIVRRPVTSLGSGMGGGPFRRTLRIDRLPVLMLVAMGLFGCGDGARARDGGWDAGHTGGRSGSGGARMDAGVDGHGSGGGAGASLGSGGAGGFAGGGGGAIGTGGSGAAGGSGTGGSGATTGAGGSTGGAGGAGGVIGSGGAGTGTGGLGTGGQTPGTGGDGTGGQTPGTGGDGTGGQTPGTGGNGTGGQPPGTGGDGTGGQTPGTGGDGTGGQTPGTGGDGTGGQTPGTGGDGTGGQTPGTGGQGTGGQDPGTGGQGTGGQSPGTGGQGTGGQDAGQDAGGAGGAGGSTLYVVGHPDDELLFINPDLEADIQAGRRVRILYVTSGDLTDYYLAREAEVMAAGSAMAGVSNNWSCTSATYAGKAVQSCTLVGHPSLTSSFMRIGDGQVWNLFTGGTATTADNSSIYDQAQTLAVMTAIQAEFQPTRVGTLDGTLAYGGEHPDHIAAALYAFDVARSDGVARQLVMYRGYTMFADPPPPAAMPENLSIAQYTEKRRIMEIYGGPISPHDIYDEWCRRFYPIVATPGGPGPLRWNAGTCLAPTASGNGAALQMSTCDGSASQTWTVGGNGRVVGAGGGCLGIANDGVTAVIETCDGSADQRWTLMSNGQLKGTRDSCLTVVYDTLVQSQVCREDSTADDPPFYFPSIIQQWGF